MLANIYRNNVNGYMPEQLWKGFGFDGLSSGKVWTITTDVLLQLIIKTLNKGSWNGTRLLICQIKLYFQDCNL